MKSVGGQYCDFKEYNKPKIKKDKRLKSVICLTTGKIYPSITAAAVDTGSDPSNIKKVCDGKYKTTNKLKWKYYMEK